MVRSHALLFYSIDSIALYVVFHPHGSLVGRDVSRGLIHSVNMTSSRFLVCRSLHPSRRDRAASVVVAFSPMILPGHVIDQRRLQVEQHEADADRVADCE